jgi:hypothetical protein
MTSRNRARRLERLEHAAVPQGVRKVWRIVVYDTDGSRSDVGTVEWPCRTPDPTLSDRSGEPAHLDCDR